MKKKRISLKNLKTGFALIYAVIITMLILLTITSITALIISVTRQTRTDISSAKAYLLAQSALEDGIYQIKNPTNINPTPGVDYTTNLGAYWKMDESGLLGDDTIADSAPDDNGMGPETGTLHQTGVRCGNCWSPTSQSPLTPFATDYYGGDQHFITFNSAYQDYISARAATGHLDVGSGSFAIGVWVYPFGTAPYNIINKWEGDSSSGRGWELDINQKANDVASPGYIRFKMNDGGTPVDYAVNGITALSWQYITINVDRDNNKLNIYLNGRIIGTKSYSNFTGNLNTSGELNMGYSPTLNQHYYNGGMDDVRIYTRKLTDTANSVSSEVLNLYNGLRPYIPKRYYINNYITELYPIYSGGTTSNTSKGYYELKFIVNGPVVTASGTGYGPWGSSSTLLKINLTYSTPSSVTVPCYSTPSQNDGHGHISPGQTCANQV